jgi:AcrR family transcriptional regulator
MTGKRGRPAARLRAGPTGVEARILDSACGLFYREGLHAVGIDRVLAKAGAAKASLYSHYASKDDLVAAYLERRGEEWRARAGEAIAMAGADGRAGLVRLFDLVEDWALSTEFRGCPFMNAASELPDANHPAREVTRRHREWLHALVRGLVEGAGINDVDRISRAIVVLHDGAVSSALLDGDPRAVAVARFAMERIVDSARGPAIGRRPRPLHGPRPSSPRARKPKLAPRE